MNRTTILSLTLNMLVAGVGMYAGRWAAMEHLVAVPLACAATNSENLTVNSMDLVDESGQKQISFGTSSAGTPGVWFYDKAGRARMNFGLYPEGDPYIVLTDEKDEAVEIFRTFGPHNSPVLVMKSNGHDRAVLGLNPQTQDPFFVLYDSAGNKAKLFGDF